MFKSFAKLSVVAAIITLSVTACAPSQSEQRIAGVFLRNADLYPLSAPGVFEDELVLQLETMAKVAYKERMLTATDLGYVNRRLSNLTPSDRNTLSCVSSVHSRRKRGENVSYVLCTRNWR